MIRTVGLVVGLGLFSTLAWAQGTPDPLEACYQQPDGAPRLACFNAEMQRRQAAAGPGSTAVPAAGGVAAAPAKAPAVTEAQVAADTVGLQGSALRRKLKEDGVKPEPVRPIVATVIRVVPRSHDALAVVLDNGQTWEQAESMESLDVRPHDTVTIKPGILGAFFLNTPRRQHVRVHRIL
jgi:hypothetical protein